MYEKAYYIHHGAGALEGPIDLPGMMQKIRAGKINSRTLVSDGSAQPPTAAVHWLDLVDMLHQHTITLQAGTQNISAYARFRHAYELGWRFFSIHMETGFYTGALQLLALLVGLIAGVLMDEMHKGLYVGGFVYLWLQPALQLMILQRYESRHLNARNWRTQFLPLLMPLLCLSFITALLVLGGMILLLVPGAIILTLVAFMPFYVADKPREAWQGLMRSLRLVKGGNMEWFGAAFGLCALLMIGMVLVLPLPVILPIVTVALAELYEERHAG